MSGEKAGDGDGTDGRSEGNYEVVKGRYAAFGGIAAARIGRWRRSIQPDWGWSIRAYPPGHQWMKR